LAGPHISRGSRPNRNLRDKSRDKKSCKSLHAAKTFSIPQGKNNSFVHALSQKFIKTPEVLFIELYPKPVSSIFTPHLSVVYENISWTHLDAYRILVFALVKGSTISPLDKDCGHRLRTSRFYRAIIWYKLFIAIWLWCR
jgi:hypothetical protein